MDHNVFISYSTKDRLEAENIRKVLEQNNISCWIAPRDIPVGSNYTKEIPVGIRECQVFLLVFSENSQASTWVIKELDMAVTYRKVIIPFMINDFAVIDEFNFLLSGAQRYLAYEKKADSLNQLVRQIKALIPEKPANAQAPKTEAKPANAKPAAPAKKQNEAKPANAKPAAPAKKQNKAKPAQTQQQKPAAKPAPVQKPNPAAKPTPVQNPNSTAKPEVKPQSNSPVRYDGLYKTETKRGFTNYLRFFENNTVVAALSSATPEQASTWLNRSYNDKASVTFDKQTLKFIRSVSGGHTIRYDGVIKGDHLHFDAYSTFSNRNFTEEYTFWPFPK